jgi:hypothetical protein
MLSATLRSSATCGLVVAAPVVYPPPHNDCLQQTAKASSLQRNFNGVHTSSLSHRHTVPLGWSSPPQRLQQAGPPLGWREYAVRTSQAVKHTSEEESMPAAVTDRAQAPLRGFFSRFVDKVVTYLPKSKAASASYSRWMMVPAAVSTHLCIGSVYAWR